MPNDGCHLSRRSEPSTLFALYCMVNSCSSRGNLPLPKHQNPRLQPVQHLLERPLLLRQIALQPPCESTRFRTAAAWAKVMRGMSE
jgi:hypothetical protein